MLWRIINISEGKVKYNAFVLEYDQDKTIDPRKYSEGFLDAMKRYEEQGLVKIEEVSEEKAQKVAKQEDKPKQEQKTEKAIIIQEIETSGKAIEVGDPEEHYFEDFLNQHWKKIEKDLANYRSVSELQKMLDVAIKLGMSEGNKKYDLIKERIQELESNK